MKQPNQEQIDALNEYRAKHGNKWAARLLGEWLTGRDASQENGHLLRQIRNQFGPQWLGKWAGMQNEF